MISASALPNYEQQIVINENDDDDDVQSQSGKKEGGKTQPNVRLLRIMIVVVDVSFFVSSSCFNGYSACRPSLSKRKFPVRVPDTFFETWGKGSISSLLSRQYLVSLSSVVIV